MKFIFYKVKNSSKSSENLTHVHVNQTSYQYSECCQYRKSHFLVFIESHAYHAEVSSVKYDNVGDMKC